MEAVVAAMATKHELEMQLLAAIREILWRDWDPIGVNDFEDAHGEYDSYAPNLLRLLREGVSEEDLTIRLGKYRDNMGLLGGQMFQDAVVARGLIETFERATNS